LRRLLLDDRFDDDERLVERVGLDRDEDDDDDLDGLELELDELLEIEREEDRFDDDWLEEERFEEDRLEEERPELTFDGDPLELGAFSIDLPLLEGTELCGAGDFTVVPLKVERDLVCGIGRDVKDDSEG